MLAVRDKNIGLLPPTTAGLTNKFRYIHSHFVLYDYSIGRIL